jgi:hypothetical protein
MGNEVEGLIILLAALTNYLSAKNSNSNTFLIIYLGSKYTSCEYEAHI